jgi:hypothetical protein
MQGLVRLGQGCWVAAPRRTAGIGVGEDVPLPVVLHDGLAGGQERAEIEILLSATAVGRSSPADRFSSRVTRLGVPCDEADFITWGSGWASFLDCSFREAFGVPCIPAVL